MSSLKLKLNPNNDFVGLIEIEQLDDEEDPIVRQIAKSISLDALLRQANKEVLSLGQLAINLDFDEKGQLISLEFYI